ATSGLACRPGADKRGRLSPRADGRRANTRQAPSLPFQAGSCWGTAPAWPFSRRSRSPPSSPRLQFPPVDPVPPTRADESAPMKPLRVFVLAAAMLCCLALTLLPSPAGDAKKPAGSAPKEYVLWSEGAPFAKGKQKADIPTFTVYLPPADKATGAAIVICPGAGYGGLAMDHEGHQVARWLNSLGVAGVILKYRVAPYRHPAPLLDAQRALRFTRAHAKEWGIDPKRVGILGFSAGGHLASTAGTQFDRGKEGAADPIDQESCRPDFLVL